jgi:penicillin G amidase
MKTLLVAFCSTSLLLLSNGALVGQTPSFEPVQPELFSAPGAQPIAVADFDGDGHPDIFVGFRDRENRLYRNSGDGTFIDVARAAGIADLQDTRAAAWGDFNGNGLPDLYVGFAAGSTIPNRLYRNNGDGTFTDIGQEVGVAVAGESRQMAWIDFDNDGQLDLFVAFRDRPNMLFRNDAGRFTDVAPAMGVDDPRRTVGAVWFDYDMDGRLDLFVANQDGDLNGFYRNDGDRFVDVAAQLGMDGAAQRAMDPDHGGVGVTIADFDNNGHLDLYLVNYGPNELFLNQGNGTFRDVAGEQGSAGDFHSVAAKAADFDNDGLVDIYVTTFLGDVVDARDQLYRNAGGSFVDVLPENIANNDGSHGVQWLDTNGNGAVDLMLANNHAEGTHYLFRNLLPSDRARRSLQVLVQDRHGGLTRAGSEVRLYRAGTRDLLGTGLVDTGGGYASQNIAPVHFGLGEYEGRIDVEVTFLTSAGRQVTRVRNVEPRGLADRPLIVRQGEDQRASPVDAACVADLLNEEAVVRVNAGYEASLRASDVDALQRILAPDFLFITSSGEVRDRQELLRSYGAREVSLRVFTSENVRVRFHGNVGILTADITKAGEYLSGPRAGAVFTGRYRFTRVYACGSGGWQLVSTHESQLGM